MFDLTVVVMAYNEVDSLGLVVQEIEVAVRSLGCSYEILIIDDGSSDGTEVLADRLQLSRDHIRCIHHLENSGLGGVYRTGFSEANGRFTTFYPADGQFPADIIQRFYPLMTRNALVLGYLRPQQRSMLAELLSWLERVLYWVLFGPMPRFQGIVMFHTCLLTEFILVSSGRGWAVLMEFILRVIRAGYRVESVPTEVRPRLSGVSKVNNLRTIMDNMRQVVVLRRQL